MVVEKGYKQTEVGVIPEDWIFNSLKKICVYRRGSFPQPYGLPIWYDEINGAPFVQVFDVDSNWKIKPFTQRYISEAAQKLSVFAPKGTIILTIQGSIGKLAITQYDAYIDRTLLIFESFKIKHDNKYFCFAIESLFEKERQSAPGGIIKTITKEALSSFLIPLPPLPEQTAIANALSDIDALIAQTEKLIEKKKAIKQGVMQELLKPKEGWVTKKLGDVCEIIMGQSPLSEYYNFAGIGLPLIQGNADIKNRKTIIRTYSSNITKKGKLGDIIMTVRAPVGEIALSTFECCLGRGVCALRYENDFMYHYLISIENYWSSLSSGSTFDSVNSNQIKDLPVTLPLIKNEQIEIAITLTDLDKDIELIVTKLQKLKYKKQGMMQALLTGKIRLI
jgi:type I restriction enzyme S subunit